MYTITKEFAFEAAHHLPHMPPGHQCARPHGHSYRVTVELRSAALIADGFVRDFGELKAVKQFLDEHFDHRNLAAVLGTGEATTAERLAALLFWRFESDFPELWAVTVCETAKTTARYSPFEYDGAADFQRARPVRRAATLDHAREQLDAVLRDALVGMGA